MKEVLAEAAEWSASSGCPRRMDGGTPRTRELTGGWILAEGLTRTASAALTLPGCFLLAGRVLLARVTRAGLVYRSWGLRGILGLAKEMGVLSAKGSLLLWPHRAQEVGLAQFT